jgi:iron complex outermembrane recepter protein
MPRYENRGTQKGEIDTVSNHEQWLGAHAVLAFIIGALATWPALGKEAGGDEPVRLDEIVVTAQKRVQGANDVGITLNAFSGDELAARGVATSEDLALFTPGLTVNETAATGVPIYTIRGVGFQDYSTAASSTVGLYFDEIAMPYTVMSRGAVFDLERVEVLKGPQGTLYGRNTTGGQINYISKLPTNKFTGGIKAGYGSFQTFDAEGYVSGPLSENLRGRLAFTTTQSSEGWQRSRTRDDKLGKQDVFAVRGLLQGDFGPVDALLRVQYVKDDSDNKANTAYDGSIAGLPEFALPYKGLLAYLGTGNAPWYSTGDNRAADWTNSYTDPNGVTYNLRPHRNNDLTSVSLKLNWKLSDDVTLTSVSGYDKFKRNETNDWDGMAINDSSNINTSDIKVFSQELRVTGQSSALNWVGGVYYSDDKVDEFYNYFMSESLFGLGSVEFGIPPFQFSPIFQLHTRYSQKTTSAAAFGHVEYNVTERLGLTGGLRYTDEKRRWSGCTFDAGEGTLAGFLNFAFGSSLAPGACGTIDDDPNSPNYIFGVIGGPNANNAFHVYNETLRAKKWMYKVGLDYKLTPDMLAYATYSRGFKSGGFNGANSNTTQQLKGYKPEELDSFEIGLKSSLLEHRMQLNLAAFYYDYKNKQEQDLAVTFVGNISGLTNVPKSRIVGAEADLQWTPVKGLLFNLGAAWLDTKVKEWQAVSPTSVWPNVVRFDASGIELPQSPKMQVNGGVDYEREINGNLKLRMGVDGNYKGSTTGGAKGTADATDSYAIVNARIGVGSASDRWMVTLWARNLTDKYYFPAAYQGGNGPWVRSVGMARTIGITGEYKF